MPGQHPTLPFLGRGSASPQPHSPLLLLLLHQHSFPCWEAFLPSDGNPPELAADAARPLAECDRPGRLRPGGKGCGRSCKPPMTPHAEVAGGGLDWNLPRCKCFQRSDSALRFSSLPRQQIWLPKFQGCCPAGLCRQWGERAPLPPRALLSPALLHLPGSFSPNHPFCSLCKATWGQGGLPASVDQCWRGNRNLEGKNNPRNSLPPATLPPGPPAWRGLVCAAGAHLAGSCMGYMLPSASLQGQKELLQRGKCHLWPLHQPNSYACTPFISISPPSW